MPALLFFPFFFSTSFKAIVKNVPAKLMDAPRVFDKLSRRTRAAHNRCLSGRSVGRSVGGLSQHPVYAHDEYFHLFADRNDGVRGEGWGWSAARRTASSCPVPETYLSSACPCKGSVRVIIIILPTGVYRPGVVRNNNNTIAMVRRT